MPKLPFDLETWPEHDRYSECLPTYIVFASHDAHHADGNPDLCGQTPCSHLSERKAGLVHIRKAALTPDCVIPLDVDEIWDDLLLFHHGLLLCLEKSGESQPSTKESPVLTKHPAHRLCRSHIWSLFD